MEKEISRREEEDITGNGVYADLMNDVAFRWVFGRESNKDLLKDLLETFIPELKIKDLTYTKDKQVGFDPKLKKSVFDISCLTDSGKYVDIEVQVKPQDYFADRCLYYATYLIQEQLQSGSSTYDLKPVYIFSIDSFSRSHGTDWEEDRIVSTYSIREDECLELLTGSLRFVFVELDRFRKKKWEDLDNDRERYYFCLKHLHELKERMPEYVTGKFARLVEQARLCGMPIEIRKQYISAMVTEMDRIAQDRYVERVAREKALVEGREKGLAEGRAEGEARKQCEIAKALKSAGVAIETIASCTGLSVEQIMNL